MLSACQTRAALIHFGTRDARNDTKFCLSKDHELTLGSLLFFLDGFETAHSNSHRLVPNGSSLDGVKEPCTPMCPVSPHILAPPAQSSISFRAPPPSLGSPHRGSRASESRVTPVPGTDGPSHLRASMSPVGPLPAGLRRRRDGTDHPDRMPGSGLNTPPGWVVPLPRCPARVHAPPAGQPVPDDRTVA